MFEVGQKWQINDPEGAALFDMQEGDIVTVKSVDRRGKVAWCYEIEDARNSASTIDDADVDEGCVSLVEGFVSVEAYEKMTPVQFTEEHVYGEEPISVPAIELTVPSHLRITERDKPSDEARHRATRLINNCMEYGAVDDLEKAREELDRAIELMLEEDDD